MRTVVRQAMRDGAFGVASALIYPPGNYAGTEELIEEAKAMAPYGGVYITHMRSEGERFVEAVDEAMRIGREGGVPVEIYHLKAAGVKNWPKMQDRHREDRFGARRGAGRRGRPVSVHRRRQQPVVVHSAMGARGRQAARPAPRRARRARRSRPR